MIVNSAKFGGGARPVIKPQSASQLRRSSASLAKRETASGKSPKKLVTSQTKTHTKDFSVLYGRGVLQSRSQTAVPTRKPAVPTVSSQQVINSRCTSNTAARLALLQM